MKCAVFVDTGYFLALMLKRDALHQTALAASGEYPGPFVTTDLVLVEIANSLAWPSCRVAAVGFIDTIRSADNTTVVPFGTEEMAKAFALYKERLDKAWGLVDCFSFVTMKEMRITVALTFDEHFRQAGFQTPLAGV